LSKLIVENITKRIKKTQILHGISLEANTGQIVGLLGPNGAGKTTSFYAICGLLKPDTGKVFLDNVNITNFAMHKRAQIGIGYLPQESSVFKELSVEDNLMLAAEITIKDKKNRQDRVEKLLEMFNIEPIRDRLGISLSGGERRRCEIARALVARPKFLFLDEPFAGVDPIAVSDIQNIIRQLKEQGIGVVITDHNVRETLAICDHAYVIKSGKVLVDGTSEEIYSNEDVRKFYLGDDFRI
jgi:lipopolysaccharide export system ATP-binding protein